PRDLFLARPGLAHRAVARDRHVLAVLVAAADQLGHVLVHVLRDQGRQRQGAVVDRGPVLDLEDRVGRGGQGADDAGVAGAERRALDELYVAAAPPAVALASGHVGVSAGPVAGLLSVSLGGSPGRAGA